MFKQFKKLTFKIYDSLRKWYIIHEDIQTPSNGVAIFGPFRGFEMSKRLNDAYADLLAGSGNVDGIALTRSYVKTIYVNPRKHWMQQLKEIKAWSR